MGPLIRAVCAVLAIAGLAGTGAALAQRQKNADPVKLLAKAQNVVQTMTDRLRIEIATEVGAEEARSLSRNIGQTTPWYLSRFVTERIQQVPGTSGLRLRLPIAIAFDLARDFGGISPRVRPDNLCRHP